MFSLKINTFRFQQNPDHDYDSDLLPFLYHCHHITHNQTNMLVCNQRFHRHMENPQTSEPVTLVPLTEDD